MLERRRKDGRSRKRFNLDSMHQLRVGKYCLVIQGITRKKEEKVAQPQKEPRKGHQTTVVWAERREIEKEQKGKFKTKVRESEESHQAQIDKVLCYIITRYVTALRYLQFKV